LYCRNIAFFLKFPTGVDDNNKKTCCEHSIWAVVAQPPDGNQRQRFCL